MRHHFSSFFSPFIFMRISYAREHVYLCVNECIKKWISNYRVVLAAMATFHRDLREDFLLVWNLVENRYLCELLPERICKLTTTLVDKIRCSFDQKFRRPVRSRAGLNILIKNSKGEDRDKWMKERKRNSRQSL